MARTHVGRVSLGELPERHLGDTGGQVEQADFADWADKMVIRVSVHNALVTTEQGKEQQQQKQQPF